MAIPIAGISIARDMEITSTVTCIVQDVIFIIMATRTAIPIAPTWTANGMETMSTAECIGAIIGDVGSRLKARELWARARIEPCVFIRSVPTIQRMD
jgi:hypothetical protein